MIKQRIQTLQQHLQNEKLDFAFIQEKANFFYLTGFRCEPHERLVAVIIPAHSEPFIIAPLMEQPLIKEAGWKELILTYLDTDNPWDILSNHLNQTSISKHALAIEPSSLSYQRSQHLLNLNEHVELYDIEPSLSQARLIKTKEELDILQEAARFADLGVEIGVSALAKGKTELEVLATIEYELKKKGVTEMSFDTIVLSGANSANPHGNPGLNPIEEGSFVLFDLGVVWEGYCSDITRTVGFGNLSEKQEEIYHTVLHAQEKAISASKVGTKLKVIDLAARSHIKQEGYGDYFPHRLGHGLGVDVHEWPSINETNELILQEAMVYTIEPGIYVPKYGGVRIEDDIAIQKGKALALTQYPKELQIIKPS
ncbi:putative peptidase [Bacillus sp. TS-2]|nr:putative peptidase [Bacillus sp. TS-2]